MRGVRGSRWTSRPACRQLPSGRSSWSFALSFYTTASTWIYALLWGGPTARKFPNGGKGPKGRLVAPGRPRRRADAAVIPCAPPCSDPPDQSTGNGPGSPGRPRTRPVPVLSGRRPIETDTGHQGIASMRPVRPRTWPRLGYTRRWQPIPNGINIT